MTNVEIRRNVEIRMTKPATAQLRVFRHSGFGFLLSFVIGHSTICASQVHGPNACGKNERGLSTKLQSFAGILPADQSEKSTAGKMPAARWRRRLACWRFMVPMHAKKRK